MATVTAAGICQGCRQEFTYQRKRIWRIRTYCSRSCIVRYGRWRSRQMKQPIPCAWCAGRFVQKSRDQRFCSRACGSRAYSSTLCTVASQPRVCGECRKPFTNRHRDQQFCSPVCAASASVRARVRGAGGLWLGRAS
jgi:hypothetical protein